MVELSNWGVRFASELSDGGVPQFAAREAAQLVEELVRESINSLRADIYDRVTRIHSRIDRLDAKCERVDESVATSVAEAVDGLRTEARGHVEELWYRVDRLENPLRTIDATDDKTAAPDTLGKGKAFDWPKWNEGDREIAMKEMAAAKDEQLRAAFEAETSFRTGGVSGAQAEIVALRADLEAAKNELKNEQALAASWKSAAGTLADQRDELRRAMAKAGPGTVRDASNEIGSDEVVALRGDLKDARRERDELRFMLDDARRDIERGRKDYDALSEKLSTFQELKIQVRALRKERDELLAQRDKQARQ